MAIFQVQAKDVIYRIHDNPTLNGLSNFNWDPAFNEEFLEELGNAAYLATSVEPEVSGSFDQTDPGSVYALLSKMIQTLDGSGGFTGYLFASGSPNDGVVRSADLENAVFDLIGPIQTAGAWNRSEFFPRVFLSSLSFSADASGNASASYSWEGQLAEVYRADATSVGHDIITKIATYTTATTYTLADTAFRMDSEAGEASVTATNPTHLFIASLIDENVYGDSAISDIDDQTDSGPIIVTLTGVTIPVGARITVLVYDDVPSSAFPTVTSPVTPNFIRGNKVDMWLVAIATVDIDGLADGAFSTQAFTDADQFLRVQSFDMNIDMRREALRQLKLQTGSSIYYRSSTYPLQVTASATTFASDLDDWRRIVGAPTPVVDPFDDKLDIASFEGVTYQLVARYYNGSDVTIQTMGLLDATVVGMSYSTSTGGRTEVNWSFAGSNWRLEGEDV